MMRRIIRKPSWWLASVMRKGKGRLNTRRTFMRPEARKIKARERILPSLSLRIIIAIDRNLMIKDKIRYSFLILLSPKTRTCQSRHTKTRKQP
jgi:hypothetical protein